MACPGGEFPIFKFDIYSGRRGYLTFTRKQYAKTEIGFRKLSENPTLEMTQDRFKMTILAQLKIFRKLWTGPYVFELAPTQHRTH